MNKAAKSLVAFVLSTVMLFSCASVAFALPSVSGMYDQNAGNLRDKYAAAYGWDLDNMQERTWEKEVDGQLIEFKREAGYQSEFLQDNINTTRQYLGLSTASGLGLGSGSAIVQVALAEVGKSDSYESPLGSDNVKYNTWFYGRPVHNVDLDGDGKYGYGDQPGGYFPWCCVFVSWCAEQCGLIDEVVPKGAGCTWEYAKLVNDYGYQSFKIRDTTPMGGSEYTPVPGDFMFFRSLEGGENDFGHIGIIVEVTDDGWWTVEGNANKRVSKLYYSNSTTSYSVTHGKVVHIEYPEDDPEVSAGIIFNYLKSTMNMTDAAACGALGNMRAESGCCADKTENGYTFESGAGYGIIQWTNTDATGRVPGLDEENLISPGEEYVAIPGHRRTNLINWCTANGYNYTTLTGQLEFLRYELEYYATYRNCVTAMNGYSNDREGAKQAAEKWMILIEGLPSSYTAQINTRKGYASDFWTRYME